MTRYGAANVARQLGDVAMGPHAPPHVSTMPRLDLPVLGYDGASLRGGRVGEV